MLCEEANRTFQVHRRDLYLYGNLGEVSCKPNLALLQVSRQTYFETSTLPAAHDIFFVVRHPDETHFFTNLSDAQKVRITSLKLKPFWYDPAVAGFDLWFWDRDIWDCFSSGKFGILKSLKGPRTVHVNIVSCCFNPVSPEDCAHAKEIIVSLLNPLKAQVGEHVEIRIHHLLCTERGA